jgi:hypothetical protein
MLKDNLEKWNEAVDWINLIQNREQWWYLVNTAMNLQVS